MHGVDWGKIRRVLKTQIITYQYNVIVVNPIDDESENPFKGGVYTNSYMILVDNFHKYRQYGIQSSVSEIYGDVTIYGNLQAGEVINIYNLNVRGVFIIDIGEGHINIYNSNLSKVLTLSAGYNTVQILDGSMINALGFKLKKPVHFKVDGDNVFVNNINMDELKYNKVKLSGNIKSKKNVEEEPLLLLQESIEDCKDEQCFEETIEETINIIDMETVKENKILRTLKKIKNIFR